MTAFDRDEFDRYDWMLFQNSSVLLYHAPAILEEACTWLAEHGYDVCRVDARPWRKEADALRAIGEALSFPGYYGQNLAALADCLSDLEPPDGGGIVVVFLGYDRFAKADRSAAYWILDILAERSRRHLLCGDRLLTLVQTDDSELEFEPVGATPVWWNPQEWLKAARGL